MDDSVVLEVLHATADAVRAALDLVEDWGPSGEKMGQYHLDVAANTAAVGLLEGAGLGVLSEETGLHHPDRPLLAVLDPVDGSTNCSRGVPWFATAIAVLDAEGPRVALVVNQATGTRFEAVRGGGARCDGTPIAPSGATAMKRAIVGLAGYPSEHLGWRQFRSLGAAALDLCAVASGVLDAYADCSPQGMHGVWDYAAAALICEEAGAVTADALGRDLVHREHGARRCPLAAATPELLDELSEKVAKAARKKP